MTALRNRILSFLYKNFLKKLFFRFDPENIHDKMVFVGEFLGRHKITRYLTSALFNYQNPSLQQTILGITFLNPVGLAAGFDKDARLTEILPSLGFGFMETGSVTGQPCAGNPKPRLWRLKKSQSLAVYYGLKNDGCEIIAKRLRAKQFTIPLGISAAKTNSPDTCQTESGIADYAKVYAAFANIGAYTTINISCPNAFGGEPFTDPARLSRLLNETDKIATKKPTFVKLSPDLSLSQVDEILNVISRHKIQGVVCGNLTKNRNNPKILDAGLPQNGGLSGKVCEDLSNAQIAHIFQKTRGRLVIVGCGGIFNAKDAYKKIRLGASLLQLITGMIYEGPQVISEINRGLAKLLKADGYANLARAVGADV